jgi:trk system potassium uptake protein TrkA
LITQVRVHLGWVGRRMSTIEQAAHGRVAYLTRLGEGIVPGPDTVYQEGDLVHLALRENDAPAAEAVLAATPSEGDH